MFAKKKKKNFYLNPTEKYSDPELILSSIIAGPQLYLLEGSMVEWKVWHLIYLALYYIYITLTRFPNQQQCICIEPWRTSKYLQTVSLCA